MARQQRWYVAQGGFWKSRKGGFGGQSEKFGFLEYDVEEGSNIMRHIMVCGVNSYRKNFQSEI